MTRVFVFTNHKGGVGKSTSATNTAYGIASMLRRAGAANARVLLIDTDSQAHATLVTTGTKDYGADHSLYTVLMADRQNAAQALYACMKTTAGEPDPAKSAKRAKELAAEGAIDPLAGLAQDNVYLFSGNEDQTVTRPVVKAAEQFLKEVGVDPGNITLVEGEGGHAFLTEEGGAACGITEKPYVSDCDYDQAKAILGWIYGPLAAASPEPQGKFVVFDQQPFTEPGDGFGDEGVVYIPPACEQAPGCRVHIALHGCAQSREAIGDAFVKEAGFAEFADQNRLIVLFPQAKASTYNPEGCWDWWGYTGLDYLGKEAPQIKAIWSMVEQLAAAP